MDSNVIFDQNVINGFAPVLTYVACEWFLIFLMFIDALLSYLLVWFARYCRLQMPCFLCSKLLHPLHWRFLLCRNHRSEVSSFMSCQNHGNNLADCRGMCDDCLLSFTKMTGPNPDMNRLLLGKLGYDLLSRSHFAHPRSCSCCNKPWRTRHHTQRLIRLGSRGRNSAGKPNIPAPRHLSRRGSGGSLKKMRDHMATSGSEYVEVGSRSDGMAHVGYTELKIHSDSESEFLFSDDDAFLQITDFNVEPNDKRAHKSRRRKSFEHKKMPNHTKPDLHDNQDKNIHVEDKETVESSMHEHNLENRTRQKQPVKAKEHHDVLSELITMSEARPFLLGSPRKYDAGAVAQNENEAEVSGNSSPSGGEFLSPSGENGASREIRNHEHDDPSDFAQNIPSSAMEIEEFEAAMEQKESDHMDVSVSGSVANEPSSDEENGVEGDSKPLILNTMSDSLEQEQSGEEESEVNENNVAEEYFSNEEEDEVNGHTEPLTSKSESGSFAEERSSEEEDVSNIYSAAKDHSSNEEDVDNEESEPMISNNVTGGSVTEKQYAVDVNDIKQCDSAKDEHGDHEENEPLTSLNISKEESSLEHSDKDSSKVTETRNTSNGSPELKHSASVESFVSISSDIEGESLVEVLKQQLEHGRKSLRDLNKELEEERNASAIATNQAMAMITRLQEEKAALHMEALQYLRMMDEQAEHDMDALERANDVLADREKEIQDLEMELEYYRVKYPDEPREEILASMGVLGNIEETSVTSPTDETSNKASTDTKLTSSPSAGN
ncbi:GTD-binding domain [Arabidopsis thaliana x Arabidopsis arenosa]|uniref:GTD-binding domain n=1 Tax=Arabidopsis thaliana x Arabidopsis arenosa TaxID=1240361 RepID=A0A8T2AA89_9BRAS|nr:GTD-binding domain [Arabidopsis thaliana x Arabidopsis arenosa]